MTRGPVPKREEERRRRNKTDDSGASSAAQKIIVDPMVMEDTSLVRAPAPNPAWHPIAGMVYDAAKRSAIREFYEPSDWAALFVVVETISAQLNPQAVVVQNGQMAGTVVMVEQAMTGATLNAIMTSLNSLMFTEGARRRVRIEVERQAGSAAARVEAPTGENVIDIRRERLG